MKITDWKKHTNRLPFQNWHVAPLQEVGGGVILVVSHPPQGHVERVLAEGTEVHKGLEIVPDSSFRVAVMLDFAADQKTFENKVRY